MLTSQINEDLLIKIPTIKAYNKSKLDKIILDVSCSSKIGLEKKDIISLVYVFLYTTGRYPFLKKAKKSVASFKLRKGTENGVFSTFRKKELLNLLTFFNILILPQIAITSYNPVSVSTKFPIRSRTLVAKNKLPALPTSHFNYGIKDLNSLFIHNSNLFFPLEYFHGSANFQFIFSTKTNRNEIAKLLLYNPLLKDFNRLNYIKNKFILSCYSIPTHYQTFVSDNKA